MRLFIRISLLAVLLTASRAAAVLGQFVPVPLGASPEASEAFGFTRPNVAVLPGGRFATVWTRSSRSAGVNGDGGVYLQLVRADGTPVFESPGRPVAASPAREADAVVAVHAEEGVLVAWRRFNKSPQETPVQLFVQWMDGEGRPRWGAEGAFAVPVSRTEFQHSPALLASPDGGAFVCFERQNFRVLTAGDIYCQRFSREGKRLWGKNGVRVFAARRRTEAPRMVADGAGGVLVFWRSGPKIRGFSDPGSIRGQRLGPDGRPLWGGGTEGRVLYRTLNPASAFPPLEIGVIPDGSGGAYVAFDDRTRVPTNNISDSDVTVLRVSGAGEGLWGDGVLVASGPDAQILDSLVPGPEGGFFVGVYVQPKHVVAFHRFTAEGSALWPAEGIPIVDPAAASPGDLDWFTYSVFGGGALRVSWEHHSGFAHESDVRFGALDLAGNRLRGPAGIPLTNAADFNNSAGLAFDPESGASFVIWQRFGDDENDALGALVPSR